MKILFISTIIPFPPKGGHSQRTFNLLKFISRYHQVYLVGFMKNKDDAENVEVLERICTKVYPFSTADDWSRFQLLKNLIRNIFSRNPYTAAKYYLHPVRRLICTVIEEEKIDVVHCDMVDLALYCNEAAKSNIVVFHNVESRLYNRRSQYEKNIFTKIFFLEQSRKMAHLERSALRKFDVAVAVSEEERQELLTRSPDANVTVIPNGVDTEYFKPWRGDENEEEVVFVGGLGWFPNEDGVLFFLEKVWPRIRARRHGAKFVVIGRTDRTGCRLKSWIKNGPVMGVKFLGFVDDIRPVVGRASVFVVPLRVGGGTRLKILDAMALEKAVVSTSIGCEGLEVRDGDDILIADKPEEFAAYVVRLMDNQSLRRKLATAARKLVKNTYSWEIIGPKMNAVYSDSKGGW